MRSEGYMALRSAYKESFDTGDPWGSNIAWLFALAEYLTHETTMGVPAAWEFTDSPVHHDDTWWEEGEPDSTIKEMDENGEFEPQDAWEFGDVLSRYDNLLRLAGKNY